MRIYRDIFYLYSTHVFKIMSTTTQLLDYSIKLLYGIFLANGPTKGTAGTIIPPRFVDTLENRLSKNLTKTHKTLPSTEAIHRGAEKRAPNLMTQINRFYNPHSASFRLSAVRNGTCQ